MPISRGAIRIRPPGPAITGLALVAATAATLVFAITVSHAGPCTTQIAALQKQIQHAQPGPATGPSATQSVGAQLHHQPTPSSVGQAKTTANADASAALDRARQADAEGNADVCQQALRQARHLYGID